MMEDGFYFVKLDPLWGWTVGEVENDLGWLMVCGSDIPCWLDDLEGVEIGPKIEPPEDETGE